MNLQSEKITERYLCKKVKELGGLCRKFVSPSVRGAPDRLCMLPFGLIFFVEVKSEGRVPTAIQELEHSNLRSVGQRVYVVSTKEEVNQVLKQEIRRLQNGLPRKFN